MNHPRTIPDVRRSRLASLLSFWNRLLILAGAGLLSISLFANDHHLVILGPILVGGSLALIAARWIGTSRSGYPFCRTLVLAPMECMELRTARHLLGSYKLRVALPGVLTERCCPNRNEPAAMDAGNEFRGSHPRDPG